MRMELKNMMVMALSGVLLCGSNAGLFAQDDKEVDLQALVLKKYDANLDGQLTGLERDGAISFLKGVDRSGDNKISDAEKKVAIQSLNRMPDPKPKPKVDPRTVRKPTTLGGVMKGVKAGEVGAPDPTVPRAGAIPKITIGPRPTKDSIGKRRKEFEAMQKMKDARRQSMNRRPTPVEPPKQVVRAKQQGYYDTATIIAVPGAHSIVPRGAVLFVPPDKIGMIVKKPSGKLVRWPEFLKQNSKWIATREVSWETAKGEDPIKEEERKSFAEGTKLVVAVFKKNPITVLEPPPEEAEDTSVKGAVGSDSKRK